MINLETFSTSILRPEVSSSGLNNNVQEKTKQLGTKQSGSHPGFLKANFWPFRLLPETAHIYS